MNQILNALKRGALRLFILLAIGTILVYTTDAWPTFFGEIGAPLLRGFGLTFIGLAIGDFALRILQPHVDTSVVADKAVFENNLAAGYVYFGRCFLYGVILFLIVTASRAEVMPPNAVKYSPLLVTEKNTYWPNMNIPSVLAAQVEQESCISLKSKTCWSPEAKLSTSRELGRGLGQITKAFNADGSIRFDSLSEMVNKYPKDLAGFSWSNYSDPKLQLRCLVLMMRDNAKKYAGSKTQLDQLSFTFAAYNGGAGGVSSDKLACRAKVGCDPTIWFDNVELTSNKSKVVIPGYGQSPYSINRTYVVNVEKVRRVRYLSLDKQTA